MLHKKLISLFFLGACICFGVKASNYAPTSTQDVVPENQVPERTGLWTFDNSADLLACSEGTATLQAGICGSKTVTLKENAASANITQVDGPSTANKAVHVPAASIFKLITSEGASTNEYTIQMDIKVASFDDFNCLLQVKTTNTDDGDIFINKNGQIGVGTTTPMGYAGKVYVDTWHRVVLVNRGSHMYVFLDGTQLKDATNTRWNLSTDGALLFADENDEVLDIEVAEVAYWDQPLTNSQVSSLGKVNLSNYVMEEERLLSTDVQDGDLLVFEAASTTANYGYYVKEVEGTYKWTEGFDSTAVWQVIATGKKSSRYTAYDTYYLKNASTGNYLMSGKSLTTSASIEDATEFVFFHKGNYAPYAYGDYSNQTTYPRGWDYNSWVVFDIVDFWWRNDAAYKSSGNIKPGGNHTYMWNVRKAYSTTDLIEELETFVTEYNTKDYSVYIENAALSELKILLDQANSYLTNGTTDNRNYLRVLNELKATSSKLVLRSYEIGERLTSTQIKPGDKIVIEAASTTKLHGHYLTEQTDNLDITNRNCLTIRGGYEERDIWEVLDGGNGNIILRNYLTQLYISRSIGQLTYDISKAYSFTLMNPVEADTRDYTDQSQYPRGWDENSVVFNCVENNNYWLGNDVSPNLNDNKMVYFNGPNRKPWNVYRAVETLNADIEDNAMTLYGQLTPETFSTFVENTDVANVLSVDLTKTSSIANITLEDIQNEMSTNALVIAPEGTSLSGNNLIINGECENLVITDGKPFAAPVDFTATNASYERTMPNGSTWGTICLPYEVKSDETTKYYTSGSIGDGVLNLTETSTVPAGTPAIFQTNATKLSAIGTGDVKANLKNATSDITLIGTYAPIKITDASAYYIKSNKFWRRAEGADGYFTVAPFRAYFTAVNSASPSFNILVNDDDMTGINDFIEKSAEIVCYYDLEGNKYNTPQKGVNIVKYTTGETQTIIIK